MSDNRPIHSVEIPDPTGSRANQPVAAGFDGLPLEIFFEMAADGITVHELDSEPARGHFVLANPAMCKLLGYAPQEMQKMSPWEILSPEEVKGLAVENEKLRRNGVVIHTKTLIAKDGRRVTVEISNRLFDRDGEKFVISIVRDLTERKRMEEALESAARLPQENPDPVMRVRQDGLLQYANPAANSLLAEWGCVAGRKIPSDIAGRVAESASDSARRDVECACGSRVYLLTLVPVSSGAYVNIYSHDVTERNRVEMSLKAGEEMFKRAQEIAHLGSWELDVVNNRLVWSDEVYRIFGLQPQEFGATYEAFLKRVHPEDRAAVDAAYSGSIRDGRDTYEIEHRVVRKDTGGIRIVHEKCEHFRDCSGKIIRSVGMVHDVTESKLAEAAILKAKQEWERTFDSVPDLIAILDDQHRITRVNRAMADRLGKTPAECVGVQCYRVVHGTDSPPVFCPHALTLVDDKQHLAEVHEENLGGDFLVSTTPLRDPEGRNIGSVHVARDITERKRTETFREAINSINQIIHSTRDVDDIISKAVAEASKAIGCQTAAVSLRKGDRWVVSHVHGMPTETVGAEMNDEEEPHAVLAIKTGKPVAVNDAFNDERVNREHMKQWDIRSVLAVPLVVRNEAIGVIFFNHHKSAAAFTDAHVDFAAQLAAAMSLALENARLFGDLEKEITESKRHVARIERLTGLYAVLSRVNEAIVRTREEKRLFREVCRIVAEDGEYPLVWVGRVKDEQVVPVASYGPADGYLQEIRVEVTGELGRGPTGTCIRENHSVINDDFGVNPSLAPWRKPAARYGFQSSVAFPLRRQGKAIGALTIYATTRAAFDAEQVALLEALSADISYALDAMLHDQLRVAAEHALRDSEARYRALFESMSEGFAVHEIVCDEKGRPCDYRFLQANPAFERMTGLKAQEILGKTVCDVLPGAEPLWIERYGRAAITGEPDRFESWAESLKRWYEVSAFRTEANRFAVLFLDITDRKEAELRLRDLNETLEQRISDRTTEVRQQADQLRALATELSQVEQRERRRLARILHDHIQQLLVAARMQLEMIKPDVKRGRALSTLQGVDSIIKEAISSARSLTVELSPPVLHEAGLIGGLNWLASRLAEKHQFTVHLRSDNQAEPPLEETRFLLFECARELLFNAVKHSGVSEAHVTLEKTRDGQVKLTVKDEGNGFDPDRLHKRRADDAAFGLFSIQQRVTHLCGQRDIETARAKGTKITLTVPLGKALAAAEPAPSGAPSVKPLPMRSRRKTAGIRVLLVDDHKIMRQGLAGLLNLEPGIDVVGEAADGPEAIKLAAKLRPDVIIMDVNLGVMSGIKATKIVLSKNPEIKIIGLSMYVDGDVAMAMREAGACAYLTKGGPSEDLIDAIKACKRTPAGQA